MSLRDNPNAIIFGCQGKALEDEAFSQRWEMLIDRGFSKHWRQPVKGGLTHA